MKNAPAPAADRFFLQRIGPAARRNPAALTDKAAEPTRSRFLPTRNPADLTDCRFFLTRSASGRPTESCRPDRKGRGPEAKQDFVDTKQEKPDVESRKPAIGQVERIPLMVF
jgi:hypothetical protein